MIIGATGLYSSGKDSVAEYLEKKGFKHLSLSDFLRQEAGIRGIEVTRENLINLGNELRTTHGHGVLGERAYNVLNEKEEDYVVTSIRHPAEVKALRKHGHFFLIEVNAPIKKRFEWMSSRKRGEDDPKTLAELKEFEARESADGGPGQQLTNVIKMAKYVVKNSGTKTDLNKKIDKLVGDLRKKTKKMPIYVRPSWDDYFMNLAREVGKRGTCDRGRAGTVIVRDKRLIAAGYVGSPVGVAHCDQEGHQLKKVIHEDGSVSTHCVRTTHSEQNAICQAARYGTPIMGATLYTKMTPCAVCAKMIVNAGIKRVVCEKFYHGGKETADLFKKAGVAFEQVSHEMVTYKDM